SSLTPGQALLTLDRAPIIKGDSYQESEALMSPAEIFRTYLQRFTSGDTAGAAELLTDDFRFHGPMLVSQGKAAFLEGSSPLGPIMRGVEIHRQWEDGGELCSFYDFKI